MFVLPTFGLGVIGSPTVPPETFDTATLENGQTAVGNSNTLTFTVNPSASIGAGSTLTIAGLTGSQTADSGSLTIGGAGAAIFGSSGSWTQSSGTLVLTVAGGQSVPTGSDTVITFTLTNPSSASSGVTGITLASDGFTTANISGTFLNAVATFNVTTRDTEANILASTPTNPSGEVNIAFGTDTYDFYIWDGSAWYIYNNFNDYSVNFDGTNDYMDIPDSTALETTAFTWSAWFYCTAINRYNIIVDTATHSSTFNGYELFVVNTTNKIRFASYSSSDQIDSTTVVAANTWYHVAATHESGSDKLYVNGSLEASGSASGFSVSDAANLRIGSSSIFNLYHQGLIDEVSFFNSALSASDVSSIYNSGTPGDISSLSPVGWWRMGDNDGGTGTTVTDQGSGGNDGTLTNGATFSTSVPS